MIIAIDGHSACGKSTLAKDLAKALNITYIDSGAMYRATTLYYRQKNILPNSTNGGWNGKIGVKNAPKGVYIYAAKIRFLDKVVDLYSGNVTLIR